MSVGSEMTKFRKRRWIRKKLKRKKPPPAEYAGNAEETLIRTISIVPRAIKKSIWPKVIPKRPGMRSGSKIFSIPLSFDRYNWRFPAASWRERAFCRGSMNYCFILCFFRKPRRCFRLQLDPPPRPFYSKETREWFRLESQVNSWAPAGCIIKKRYYLVRNIPWQKWKQSIEKT